MENIQFGPSRGDQAVLGRKLAEMHKASKSDNGFGFDVTIGSCVNLPLLLGGVSIYQYGDSLIHERGKRLSKNLRLLFKNIAIEPCLLHGDLWSGNVSSDTNGDPIILDPACYYGHNEADFEMSWCAGFGGSFYNAYFEVMPKQSGFEKRRDLYMLYHYLNHYNLFGSG